MKKLLFSYGLLMLFLFGCTTPKSNPDLFITFGKLQAVSSASCGEANLIFVSEDGEKLHPNNLEEFLRKPEANKEFQVTYQEIAFHQVDSCMTGTPILINHLEPIPTLK